MHLQTVSSLYYLSFPSSCSVDCIFALSHRRNCENPVRNRSADASVRKPRRVEKTDPAPCVRLEFRAHSSWAEIRKFRVSSIRARTFLLGRNFDATVVFFLPRTKSTRAYKHHPKNHPRIFYAHNCDRACT